MYFFFSPISLGLKILQCKKNKSAWYLGDSFKNYFPLSGQFPGDQGLVAPGMSCHYTIRFSPDSLADYDDEIIVQTQASEPIVVQLHGRRPPPILTCKWLSFIEYANYNLSLNQHWYIVRCTMKCRYEELCIKTSTAKTSLPCRIVRGSLGVHLLLKHFGQIYLSF